MGGGAPSACCSKASMQPRETLATRSEVPFHWRRGPRQSPVAPCFAFTRKYVVCVCIVCEGCVVFVVGWAGGPVLKTMGLASKSVMIWIPTCLQQNAWPSQTCPGSATSFVCGIEDLLEHYWVGFTVSRDKATTHPSSLASSEHKRKAGAQTCLVGRGLISSP